MGSSAISIQDAQRAISAAQARADELKTNVCIAIVDEGGNLKALARMDGAPFLAIELARSKARTAAGLGVTTQDFAEAVSGSPALLAGLSAQPDIALLPGGLPVITDEGDIRGAIGVAGGTNGEDHPISQAGLAALAS